MEYLDVIDENGNLTGQKVERSTAHQKGLRHRVSHIWLFRHKEGNLQVLLQQRSSNTEVFPDCFDISSAGHVAAGEDYQTAALRELKEELGIVASIQDLHFVTNRNITWDGQSNGKPYHDRHLAKVFLMFKDIDEEKIRFDTYEVQSVKWMNWKDCMDGVKKNTFKHDMEMEELILLNQKVAEYQIWDTLYQEAIRVLNPRKISKWMEAGGVASAIESSTGKIYTGICVDGACNLGICAERNAVFSMLTHGEEKIKRVIAVNWDGNVLAPCGACRELMTQLMPETYGNIEIMLDYGTNKIVSLKELTPEWWI